MVTNKIYKKKKVREIKELDWPESNERNDEK